MADEDDDDTGDDGEDDEDDDDGEDEDEDISEDDTALMPLADTDVEGHDETGLGDEYNDDMVDEEEDDFHENRVIEVRGREALDGLDHLQVLGQPGADSGLIDIAAEPFEGVNVDDLFGLCRPLGFDRRRQSSRASFERYVAEGNGLQHPLLLRPSQSGDMVTLWSSGGNSSSRDLEALCAGSFGIAQFYMFDAPVLPFDHVPSSVFGDRMGAAPPSLDDFSVGLESLWVPGRRGQGMDGGLMMIYHKQEVRLQPLLIAQAVEEQFVSQLRGPPASSSAERQSNSSGPPEKSSDVPSANDSQY